MMPLADAPGREAAVDDGPARGQRPRAQGSRSLTKALRAELPCGRPSSARSWKRRRRKRPQNAADQDQPHRSSALSAISCNPCSGCRWTALGLIATRARKLLASGPSRSGDGPGSPGLLLEDDREIGRQGPACYGQERRDGCQRSGWAFSSSRDCRRRRKRRVQVGSRRTSTSTSIRSRQRRARGRCRQRGVPGGRRGRGDHSGRRQRRVRGERPAAAPFAARALQGPAHQRGPRRPCGRMSPRERRLYAIEGRHKAPPHDDDCGNQGDQTPPRHGSPL